ncbi:transpeptidase family protein [bacterium]|nr:transpeptidase family protein [bacterium]
MTEETKKPAEDLFVKKRVTRLRTIAVFFVLLAIGVVIRLFMIQMVNTSTYQLLAKRQYERRVTLDAERGVIYDRNMNKIAVNLINYSFAADPSFMKETDKDKVAENFASVFKKPKSEYRKLLSKSTAFVWLERRVSEMTARQINDSIRGLIKLQSLRRHYPYGKSAASILGFTNIDNQGSSGIELDQESALGGLDGWAILQADAIGRLRPNPDYPHQEPKNGRNIQLTIDMNYQTIAYQELEKTVTDYDADDGMVIIMAPGTGEILAMVNYPGFDPNTPEKYNSSNLFRNRAVTDLYEPGSTFKAFSAVAALEERVRKPEDRINCENGQIKLYNQIIHDSKKHGTLTFTEVVQKSSNIGIIKTTQLLGEEKLYQYVRAFGFGNETGIDLEGEIRGELKHPTTWSGLTLPMISIGQEVGVTALQMANAYSAIANGGSLYKPFVIQSIIDPSNDVKTVLFEPQFIRSIASKETMTSVAGMLREAVVGGTGQRAQIKGVEVAGKTGTAQKIEQGSRTYSKDKFTASFAGFFPVKNPQLVFLVIVNNPRKSIWGEASAATTARAIVEKIINSSDAFAKSINRVMAELEQDSTLEKNGLTPDVKYLTTETAKNILDKLELPYRFIGAGDMVADQAWDFDGGKKVLLLKTGSQLTVSEAQLSDESNGPVKRVPDVRGMSVRMAMNRLYEAGIDVKIKGSGFVIAQYPRAGKGIKSGERCVIQCRPSL